MKLTRLRVTELRQFRAPFELSDLEAGLNIVSGPNEAGKSTLARAIRAAFFERHRSTSVDDLRPYDDSAAAPTIELDFEIDGISHQLTKSFLQKKRCELVIGTRRFEGVEAEDALAERLGFQFALKGASREEHWGIPGLLWIEQGSAHTVRDAVLNASDHLRKALDASLGEVSASGGEEIVGKVRKLRDELLTSTSRPKAGYQKALDDTAAASMRVSELEDEVARYRQQVDQLAQLRQAKRIDTEAQPWVALRTQQATAQRELEAAESLSADRKRLHDQLVQVRGLGELLRQRLAAAELEREQLAAREAALAKATTNHENAQGLEAPAALAETQAAESLRSARQALAIARQEDNRRALVRQASEAQARATEQHELLTRASAEHERAALLRREAAALQIASADLKSLRAQHARLNELQIRQAAVATRLRIELDDGAHITLGDETVSGTAERLLVTPTTLAMPGLGRVHVVPGGSDLVDLAAEQGRLSDEHGALLQRLGLASLADAEARFQSHTQRSTDADAAEKARKLLAPKGLDALRAEVDGAQAHYAEATSSLAQLPPAPEAPALPLDVAEREHESAREKLEQATRQLQGTRQALATATSELDAARVERDAKRDALANPRRQEDLSTKQGELLDASARESALQIGLDAIDGRIAAARPDILKQDVDRFRRSADEAERLHNARALQIAQLEATLSAAGAQGLEEELSQAQGVVVHAQRRARELQRRADALDFLLQRLELQRQALTRRLQAPLQKHLDRYLQLLFPSGRLEVDERLVPGALTRPGTRGLEASDFDTLSFGAREQMGVITRLAYADLLQEAGRPTLVILDDALVHSDEQRIGQMKRVLFDAAVRHQVLLFTCHPQAWRDMGVQMRQLESLRAQ